MGMPVNPDYRDLFRIFSEENVEYLIVGAHAVAYYTEPRYTKDLDIYIRPTQANARKVWRALERFDAPLTDVTQEDFTDEKLVYQIGVEPNRIDIMMGVTGIDFDSAWKNRVESTYGSVPIYIICREDLKKSKRAAGRAQDLLDLEKL